MPDKISRTSAATAARMRASEEKAARRLIGRGWFCMRTDNTETVPPGMQLYATNGLRETYRVVDWTMGGRPILQLANGRTAVGELEYVFTVGPK